MTTETTKTAAETIAAVRKHQIDLATDLYQFWQYAIEQIGKGPTWTEEHALYCKGKTIGAVLLLQSLLAETGEIGPDEAEDEDFGAAWALVDAERKSRSNAGAGA